jgi:CDP-diacylglycerol--glycerol-3-phosphate 3-phosphatidyltransferase
MPGWSVAVVLFREFAVSGLRMIAVEQQRVIAAAWSGKIKTTVTMIGLGVILVFGEIAVLRWIVIGLILLTTVYSGTEYFIKNKDVFRDMK